MMTWSGIMVSLLNGKNSRKTNFRIGFLNLKIKKKLNLIDKKMLLFGIRLDLTYVKFIIMKEIILNIKKPNYSLKKVIQRPITFLC